MPHTCEDCGETFETLSSLRLHDCAGDEDESDWEETVESEMAELNKQRRAEEREARRTAPAALTEALDRATDGDDDAIYQLLAQYERALEEELKAEDGNYWALNRVFYEPAASALLAATDRNGWSFLLDILDAYWPATTLDFEEYASLPSRGYEERHDDWDAFPNVSHVLTNASARLLIRTRRREGVTAIPADVLEYMLLFHRHPGDNGPWVQSMTYGWGIGHPDHAVVDSLVALLEGNYDIWVGAATEHALHADQHATADFLATAFDKVDVSDPSLLFRGLASVAKRRYPSEPAHVDWEEVYPEFGTDGFDWESDVRDRLRTLVNRSGIVGPSEDWTFEDLEV